jgi:hypothetical protein
MALPIDPRYRGFLLRGISFALKTLGIFVIVTFLLKFVVIG